MTTVRTSRNRKSHLLSRNESERKASTSVKKPGHICTLSSGSLDLAAMVCSHGVSPCSSALLSVLLLVLIVTMTTGQILRNENPCLAEGGICVVGNSCPEYNRLNKTGLCPDQEKDGAICCNGVPEEVYSCRLHGGRCGQKEECQNVQRFGQLDCDEGSECCLLIF